MLCSSVDLTCAAHYRPSRQIFPAHSTAQRPASKDSALARIKQRRAVLKASAIANGVLDN